MPCVSLVTTAPSDGIAWINDNGTPSDPTDDVLRYRPEPNYHGADSFTYTLTDLAGASVTRTITLTISATNDAPVIPNLDLVTYADEALTFDLLEFAEDADGDTLTVASWTEPEHGVLTYDTETKVFTYTPDEEFLGDDSFEVTIEDGAGGVIVVQIKFTVRIPLHFATAVHDASSEFDSLNGPALAALDRPDGAAWAPTLGTYREYITLMFEATEAVPVGLIVYGDLGNAYVSRIEVNGGVVTVHAGGAGAIYIVLPTESPVASLRLFVTGYGFEIDAVQLVFDGGMPAYPEGTASFDSEINALGAETTTFLDAAGQPIESVTTFQGQVLRTVEYTYEDGVLESVAETDALGRITLTTYNADGQITSQTLAEGSAAEATTLYGYDTKGNLISLTDPVGNVTQWSYDAQNRETGMTTDDWVTAVVRTYDSESRLASITDRNGLKRTFEYDADGRLIEEVWLAIDGETILDTLTWTYDSRGRLIATGSGAGTYTYKYNSLNQVIRVEQPSGVVLTFGYDPYGNRELVIDSLGGRTTSDFDVYGRLRTRLFVSVP